MLTQSSAASAPKLSDREKAAHLLNRAGFGPRPGDVDQVLEVGLERYIEDQLSPERIDDSDIDRGDSSFDTRKADAKTIRNLYRTQPRTILNQLRANKVMRAVHSKRQIHEAMVDFWFNHFNVDWTKDDVQYVTTGYERDVIRRFHRESSQIFCLPRRGIQRC